MKSFVAIIDAFGKKPSAFAGAVGITANHAAVMRSRGFIPPEYWQATVRAATERGIGGVTLEALAGLAERRRPAPSAPVSQVA